MTLLPGENELTGAGRVHGCRGIAGGEVYRDGLCHIVLINFARTKTSVCLAEAEVLTELLQLCLTCAVAHPDRVGHEEERGGEDSREVGVG